MPELQHMPPERRFHRGGTVCSYAELRRRVQALGVPEELLLLCTTIGDVQRLARPYYRARARWAHPDSAAWHHKGGKCVNGHRFRPLAKTYAWLMRLDPIQPVHGTTRKPPLPLPLLEHDYPDIGYGWHIEYR